MSIAFALLTAILVFSIFLLVDGYLAGKKRKQLLHTRMAPDGSAIGEYGYEDTTLGFHSDMSPMAASLAGILRMLGVNAEEFARTMSLKFAQAGINSPDAPVYYLFFQRVVGACSILAALSLVASAPRGEDNSLTYLAALILVGIGVFGAKLYLKNMIDKRKKKLQRAFPDTLDLLLICVESGLALDAALNKVCAELGRAYPEMTQELNRTRLELSIINDRVRALTNLGDRTDMVAFRALIASLIQSEKFGTSLTDTLRVLSEEFRMQRMNDAEIKAARLPVIMTIPLIFLLMPAFFLIVLGPAIVSIAHNGKEITGKK